MPFSLQYFVLVVLVFTLQLVAGTLAFAFRGEVSATLIKELQAGIRRSFNETSENAVAITSLARLVDERLLI